MIQKCDTFLNMENESTEWHDQKAESNITKHEGLSFEEAAEVFDDSFALEIPEITDFSGFEPLHSEYFKAKKEQISIRFNSILIDHFKSLGKGWQTMVNDFLMESYLSGKI